MSRWQISRLGFLNFWLYDEEEFPFSGGRLLLRGANGTGKSITTSCAIPLLLDGNKSPERLDPFGSRDRRMEDYMLGEDSGREDETGYIFLELTRGEGEYITVGVGLRARRSAPIDLWGFCLRDGRRIGRDFLLYKDAGSRRPLSFKDLERRVGDGGQVVRGMQRYTQLVNTTLFGYSNPEDYKQLVDLLLKVRAPKLSKEYKPSKIYALLNDSLQLLDRADLEPMVSAFESMEEIESRVRGFKAANDQLHQLRLLYDRYNRYMLAKKSQAFLQGQSTYNTRCKELERARQLLVETTEEIGTTQRDTEAAGLRLEQLERRLDALDGGDLTESAQRLADQRGRLDRAESDLEELERDLEARRDKLVEVRTQAEAAEERRDMAVLEGGKLLRDLGTYNADLHFAGHDLLGEQEGLTHLDADAAGRTGDLLRKHTGELGRGREALRQRDADQAEYDRLEEQFAESEAALETVLARVADLRTNVESGRAALVANIHRWSRSCLLLSLEPEEERTLSALASAYSGPADNTAMAQLVRGADARAESDLLEGRHALDHEERLCLSRIGELEEELTRLGRAEELPPPRSAATEQARAILEQRGIPHVPFYRAFAFLPEVDPGRRALVEQQAADTGLLDALIVPERYREVALDAVTGPVAERFVFPGPPVEESLGRYLAVEGVSGELAGAAEQVLRSIALESGVGVGLGIAPDGGYSLGPFQGKSLGEAAARYIGRDARQVWLDRCRREAEEAIRGVREELEEIGRARGRLENAAEDLVRDRAAFPGTGDLDSALQELDRQMSEEQICLRERDRRAQERDRAREIRDLSRRNAAQIASGLGLADTVEAFALAQDLAEEYGVALRELERCLRDRDGAAREAQQARRWAEDLEESEGDCLRQADRHRREIQVIADAIQALENYLDRPENRLQADKLKALTEEIRQVTVASREAEKTLAALRERAQARRGDADRAEAATSAARAALARTRSFLVEELDLGFVTEARDVSEELARQLVERVPSVDMNRPEAEWNSNLTDYFGRHRAELGEYSPQLSTAFKAEEGFTRLRYVITFKLEGKTRTLYELADHLEKIIAETDELLNERDRQLFEEILADTLMGKLRRQIQESRDWVAEMDRRMKSLKTSMGLRFSLTWRGRRNTAEGELDADTLTRLLSTDISLMDEEDRRRLTGHFRSKVERERRLAQEEQRQIVYEDLVRDALDYRGWFTFTLYYQKGSDPRLELTDSAFNKFSGGEKAMAMYVPLFAAVHAQYKKAADDAPHILALDEAFAGVDEKNIDSMFGLLEELELGYILNSQALWGCYATVPELSIVELVRPENAQYVTLLNHRWNGRQKETEDGEG